MPTSSDVAVANEQKHSNKNKRTLEMNHSHYLMLDDGTIDNYDTAYFRTRLIQRITNQNDNNNNKKKNNSLGMFVLLMNNNVKIQWSKI